MLLYHQRHLCRRTKRTVEPTSSCCPLSSNQMYQKKMQSLKKTKILHIPSCQNPSDSACCNAHVHYNSGYCTDFIRQQLFLLGAASWTEKAFALLFQSRHAVGPLHPSKSDRTCRKGGAERQEPRDPLLGPSTIAPTFVRVVNTAMAMLPGHSSKKSNSFSPYIHSDAYCASTHKPQSDQRAHQKIVAHRSKSLPKTSFSCVLVLPGVELILLASGMVLCFGLGRKTMLVTHACTSSCWVVSSSHSAQPLRNCRCSRSWKGRQPGELTQTSQRDNQYCRTSHKTITLEEIGWRGRPLFGDWLSIGQWLLKVALCIICFVYPFCYYCYSVCCCFLFSLFLLSY